MIALCDRTVDFLLNKYQNVANFLIILANVYGDSETVVADAMLALRILMRRPLCARLIFHENTQLAVKLREREVQEKNLPILDEVLGIIKNKGTEINESFPLKPNLY